MQQLPNLSKYKSLGLIVSLKRVASDHHQNRQPPHAVQRQQVATRNVPFSSSN